MRWFTALGWLAVATIAASLLTSAALGSMFDIDAARSLIEFERPWAALLFVAAPIAWLSKGLWQKNAAPRLQVSRGLDLQTARRTWRLRLRELLPSLRAVALGLVVVALMGPRSIHARDTAELSGIEIMLTLDMSQSMEAGDIRPTRFDATKAVVQDFITRRPSDRIGAVVFGREAFTLLPLTTDREALRTALRELQLEQIDAAGTAIGNAVGVSLNRLRRSKAKSKVVILLTDGESNSGNITPLQAAELASTMQVKVFPILMGVSGDTTAKRSTGIFGGAIRSRVSYPVNPELLKKIAEQTGGEFFGVSDREALEESFHQILDRLEKTEIEDAGRVTTELFPAFVGPAILFLLFELLGGALLLRRWP